MKPADRFTIQKKNGIDSYYKGRCKDCYVEYRRKRKALGSKDGVRVDPGKDSPPWKHISWLWVGCWEAVDLWMTEAVSPTQSNVKRNDYPWFKNESKLIPTRNEKSGRDVSRNDTSVQG